jgi:hypothetical protein
MAFCPIILRPYLSLELVMFFIVCIWCTSEVKATSLNVIFVTHNTMPMKMNLATKNVALITSIKYVSCYVDTFN